MNPVIRDVYFLNQCILNNSLDNVKEWISFSVVSVCIHFLWLAPNWHEIKSSSVDLEKVISLFHYICILNLFTIYNNVVRRNYIKIKNFIKIKTITIKRKLVL